MPHNHAQTITDECKDDDDNMAGMESIAQNDSTLTSALSNRPTSYDETTFSVSDDDDPDRPIYFNQSTILRSFDQPSLNLMTNVSFGNGFDEVSLWLTIVKKKTGHRRTTRALGGRWIIELMRN